MSSRNNRINTLRQLDDAARRRIHSLSITSPLGTEQGKVHLFASRHVNAHAIDAGAVGKLSSSVMLAGCSCANKLVKTSSKDTNLGLAVVNGGFRCGGLDRFGSLTPFCDFS